MREILCKTCSLLLVFILLLGASQVSAAALLEDEGTEGNASEYYTYQSASCTDDSSAKVGSYSLLYRCPSADIHGQVYRSLSSSFMWSEFEAITVWTYRPSGHFDADGDSINIIFRESFSVLGDGARGRIQVSADPADTWVQHRLVKADFTNYYDGLESDSEVNIMAWYTSYRGTDPNDQVYLDGLDVNPEPESGGGFCLGSVAVSIITIIALVAIGTRVRTRKKY